MGAPRNGRVAGEGIRALSLTNACWRMRSRLPLPIIATVGLGITYSPSVSKAGMVSGCGILGIFRVRKNCEYSIFYNDSVITVWATAFALLIALVAIFAIILAPDLLAAVITSILLL